MSKSQSSCPGACSLVGRLWDADLLWGSGGGKGQRFMGGGWASKEQQEKKENEKMVCQPLFDAFQECIITRPH